MIKALLFSFIILLTIGDSFQGIAQSQHNLTAFSDSMFNAHITSSKIAGASVIVYQKGKMLLDKSYGFASLELSAPMPQHATFEIGSVTKQFTAAAILRLVEQGKLSLNDDMTKYVTFDTKGRKITINHLLNHTSGIPGYTEIPEFEKLSLLSFERDTLLRIIEKKDFLFEPGEALIYNNTGYFLLGLIIIKASGMRYVDYLDQQFFKPLGMKNTYYCSTSKVFKNKAYGYSFDPDGIRQKDYLDHIWPFAAGSLCSTTEDLLIWMQSLHSGKVLNKEQYALLTTPGKLKDGSPVRYAMGLTNYNIYKNKMIGHGGGINGFLSETRYYPDADLYIICLINTTGPSGPSFFANQLTWRILTKGEEKSKTLDVPLQPLEGKYRGQARGQMLSVEVKALKNSLVVRTEGRKDPDTLKLYLGNHTWARGNDLIIIDKSEFRLDNTIGYFILKKMDK